MGWRVDTGEMGMCMWSQGSWEGRGEMVGNPADGRGALCPSLSGSWAAKPGLCLRSPQLEQEGMVLFVGVGGCCQSKALF